MTTTQEPTVNLIHNTSAVASIDGDDLNTIHASDMADLLGAYNRSTALVVDTTTLHALRALLDPTTPVEQVRELQARDDVTYLGQAIAATVAAGLR